MPVYNYVTQSALELALLSDRSNKALNSNAYMFPQWKVAAFLDDNSVTLADCTDLTKQDFAGIANADVLAGGTGYFITRGRVVGAAQSLGAVAGAPIYLGAVAGSLVLTPPTGTNVTQIQVGFCVPNEDTGLPTDLQIAFKAIEQISGGGGVTPSEVSDLIEESQTNAVLNSGVSSLPIHKVVAWKADRTAELANAASGGNIHVAGVATANIGSGSYGQVKFTGIVENALAALSPTTPMQPVFLQDVVGGHLTLTAPTDLNSAIIQIGYAVPRTGTTGSPVDLLLDIQRISVP